jgi:LysM repeat protein
MALLLVTAAALLSWLAGSGWSGSGHGSDPGAATPTARAVVGPGETLWQVARRMAPGIDPRVTVERIAALNGLAGAVIQPGQVLVVPSSH